MFQAAQIGNDKSARALLDQSTGSCSEFSGRVEVMQFPELVEARPEVMMGKPCLKGTRIPVYLILEKLAAGETSEIILAADEIVLADQ